jgi:hypothetical protein
MKYKVLKVNCDVYKKSYITKIRFQQEVLYSKNEHIIEKFIGNSVYHVDKETIFTFVKNEIKKL